MVAYTYSTALVREMSAGVCVLRLSTHPKVDWVRYPVSRSLISKAVLTPDERVQSDAVHDILWLFRCMNDTDWGLPVKSMSQGLPSDPEYEKAMKYLSGRGGGMVVFGVKGGAEAGSKFIDNVRSRRPSQHARMPYLRSTPDSFTPEPAEHRGNPRGRSDSKTGGGCQVKLLSHVANVGDCKSLAIHPATTTHSQLPADAQLKGGILPELIRLSIGIESVEDIIADIDQALDA